ncbi:ralA-binding protein 1 [Scaptodrosophila lebanonensis]|uniref:RalA-binding protein 1 n=1 Tax=Drosophila lebanonensis TaxID=7225 RepID=A0A6J2TAN6_DROLE|nr:ralA-binding protein 1 [Scaptodrosophila lebanonensis]
MDFDSPEEKEFPGLYASESTSKKSKEESDYSDGEHDKHSKKDSLLIGRRKDKKDKGKDRGYAALEGESSPEEELDTKSPSKSKKSKTFKFTSSKSKEKREKSRDKEKTDKELKQVEEEPQKDKDKAHEEKEHKKKDKERKEKDKKSEKKEKDKKEKKSKQAHQDDVSAEEALALGYPVFGVSVSLATERSRCHDGIDLPLVVRDCIDYLQEHCLKCEQIYKVEPIKTRLMHYKRLYNNREYDAEVDELNLPTACSLLKLFLRELPEPPLTTDLMARFEEVASHPEVTKQQEELQQLLEQLPKCNRTLLAWVLLHFDAVIQQERHNKLNAQSLAMLLSSTLQMSHRLMVALLCHCNQLFPDVKLIKYVPPLTSSSPKLPEKPDDIQTELRKQDSLLSQIHSEMNAGFITKKREEQLWEVQRIITQLKRKLKSFEKKQEKSIEELESTAIATTSPTAATLTTVPAPVPVATISEDTTDSKPPTNNKKKSIDLSAGVSVDEVSTTSVESRPQIDSPVAVPEFIIDKISGYVLLPKTNPHRDELLRLQIEYDELIAWQNELKARILSERNEVFRLKQLYDQKLQRQQATMAPVPQPTELPADGDYERVIEHYTRENALLEHKKQMLGMELKEEKRACIALQVELRMQQFQM